MTLSDLVNDFLSRERPIGVILGDDVPLAQAIAATRFYAGFADLASPTASIGASTMVTNSEWSVIRPLFLLYVERETAIQLEASRGLGVDVFGRQVSEVSADIERTEMELPRLAFSVSIVTV